MYMNIYIYIYISTFTSATFCRAQRTPNLPTDITPASIQAVVCVPS